MILPLKSVHNDQGGGDDDQNCGSKKPYIANLGDGGGGAGAKHLNQLPFSIRLQDLPIGAILITTQP